MRQIRQTLRLHLESRLTLRECAQLLGVAKTTIGDIVRKARAAGVDWAVAQTLSDEKLEVRCTGRRYRVRHATLSPTTLTSTRS